MNSFDLQLPTRIVFARGAIRQLGELAAGFGGKRVLVVSDRGVVAAGHFESGANALRAAGLEVASFHEFGENPTTLMVELMTARRHMSPVGLIEPPPPPDNEAPDWDP